MASRELIRWKRYWAKRGAEPLLNGAFLLDPEEGGDFRLNRELATLPDLTSVPCLVLLGEPGIGKTSCLKVDLDSLAKEAAEHGEEFLEFDLRDFGSDDRLIREVFQNDTFLRWKSGDGGLQLLLDSLDECRLEIKNVSRVLLKELRGVPVDRLRFRIICRAAEWRQLLEDGLKDAWGEDKVAVWCLQPVTEANVRQAAEGEGVDSEGFLKEVWGKEATAFACRPVTLFMLLGIYRREGKLPETRRELYSKGCRHLCGELSESRLDAGATGKLDADKRLAVAARIAAVNIFCGRGAVSRNPDVTSIPPGDLQVSDLSGAVEIVKGNKVAVDETVVGEVLGTALFSSRGAERLGFAHQTYAEFLAAHYLQEHNTPIEQVLSLVTAPAGEKLRVIPQLHEVAAWLAWMNQAVFHGIMENDPQVLLGSDLATVDEKDREALVGTLLRFLANERISGKILLDYDYYRKLRHERLAEQLESYIRDKSAGGLVRRMAINIAEACEAKELQNLLADVAIDGMDEYQIRVQAAWAVVRIGEDGTRARLRPLLSEGGKDPDDELKGCALMSLWPGHITAAELFEVVTLPKSRIFIGSYHLFVRKHLMPGLKRADLPVALRWTESQPARHALPVGFDDLMDDIFVAAWQHFDEPEVLPALASALLKRCELHDDVVGVRSFKTLAQLAASNAERRKRLLHAIVDLIPDAKAVQETLFFTRRWVLFPEDLSSMLSELKRQPDFASRWKWIELVSLVFDGNSAQHIDLVVTESQSVPELRDHFRSMIRPVALDSPEAQKLKEDYETRQQWEKQSERPLLDPPPKERVKVWLERFDGGETDAWWVLNREMTLEPDSTHWSLESELESDLTVLPGWEEADDEVKERIVRAAGIYLLNGDPHATVWLGTNTIHRPAFAGYRAIRLLLASGRAWERILTPEVWKRWASIVLAYPDRVADEKQQQELVKLAYDHAPDEVIQTLAVLIDKENQEVSPSSMVWKLARCWDDRLRTVVLAKAQDTRLKPSCMADLLSPLLEQGTKEAENFARTLVPTLVPTEQVAREKALHAAQLLMLSTSDAGWGAVWPAIRSDAEFGKELIQALSYRSHFTREGIAIFPRLNEDQLADLYIWLEQQFPQAQDPDRPPGISYSPGPRDDVVDLRDGLLRHLEARGTPRAVKAVRRIRSEFPDAGWLKWVLLDAQDAMIRHTWSPPCPSELLKLISDPRRRLVESGEHLLEVVVESLNRLEWKLQGHTPHARAYWDKVPDKDLYRPVDENTFSDFVKAHLQEDIVDKGVIVNREVEVRRPSGKGLGERTDIHVDAIVQKPRQSQIERITCIIESKGCWNRDLDTAMKTQLRDKYLDEASCRHGLYLVGWFNCDRWDPEDWRKGKAPQISIEEARGQFERQAAELSDGGFVVRAFVLDVRLR